MRRSLQQYKGHFYGKKVTIYNQKVTCAMTRSRPAEGSHVRVTSAASYVSTGMSKLL